MSMDLGGKEVRSEINVTPLVDVVLVLLIIFMVITPLLQRGKAVQLPRARLVSELRQGDPILLSVTPDGRTWVDEREVPKEELSGALLAEMAGRPGAPVIVKGDKDLEYRVMREVILEITKARLVGVSLAATQVREGE
jgi:biopolymer transport protein ExbD/biopolymer transport protein TolR